MELMQSKRQSGAQARPESEWRRSMMGHLEESRRNLEKSEYHGIRMELLLAPLLKKYGLR